MNIIWRFYLDEKRQWRWQRLSAARVLISESPQSHTQYDECLADAHLHGYVFHPSQPKLTGMHHR